VSIIVSFHSRGGGRCEDRGSPDAVVERLRDGCAVLVLLVVAASREVALREPLKRLRSQRCWCVVICRRCRLLRARVGDGTVRRRWKCESSVRRTRGWHFGGAVAACAAWRQILRRVADADSSVLFRGLDSAFDAVRAAVGTPPRRGFRWRPVLRLQRGCPFPWGCVGRSNAQQLAHQLRATTTQHRRPNTPPARPTRPRHRVPLSLDSRASSGSRAP
jgi:hypothetical protein